MSRTRIAAAALLTAAAICAAQPATLNPAPRLLSAVRVGRAFTHDNLTLYPLTGPSAGLSRFLLLDEAIGSGDLEVFEKDGGEVNTVRMRNRSKSYVFGMAGEIVSGARQDRMLRDDVLLPPGSGRLDVPVYCTEHGRWQGSSMQFSTRSEVVSGGVRAKASQSRSQSDVWAEVGAAHDALNVQSPSAAFARVYDEPNVQAEMKGYTDAIGDVSGAAPDAQGVVVAVAGRIVCVDLFGSNALFRRMWPKLIRSYVIDALSAEGSGSVSAARVRRFLTDAARSQVVSQPTVGSGALYRLSSAAAGGSALVFSRQPVHLDLFPDPEDRATDDGAPGLDIRRQNSRQE